MLQKFLIAAVVFILSVVRLEAQTGHTPADPSALGPASPTTVTLSAAAPPARLMPTAGLNPGVIGLTATAQNWSYDPTSVYDQKGVNVPRGFSAEAPNEVVDPFSGNLVLYSTDLYLPGVAGLDLVLQRVYNSKIHLNYAAKATGDPTRVARGIIFGPPSPLGVGWSMHLGRLVNPTVIPNSAMGGPRYYERPDGSQHPFFTYTGAGCGDEQNDVCLRTKAKDNPYLAADGVWRLSTTDGRVITFGHMVVADVGAHCCYSVYYATEIRDVHGNKIQIFYHDNTILGIPYQREYFRNFMDRIIDSTGRLITFGYTEVGPESVRLTSITAVGRTYRYSYTPLDAFVGGWAPWGAFLTQAQPPEGAPWAYDYAGLYNGECGDHSKHWCELTQITYPQGGTITYTYEERVFWAQTNPMAVRTVETRQVAGRAVTSATWTYTYNRNATYTGDEHTVITRPDGSQEIYTYFGVGDGIYNPLGLAWKAGVLLQKRIRDAGGTVLQTETYDWEPGPAISNETWGDPWIGFDVGVFVARVRQKVIQRGNLTWITTHTAYNNASNVPRCTTEQGDGATRYRHHATFPVDLVQQGDYAFRWLGLPGNDVLR